MKHYIFEATGLDMQQRGKKRTEYKHEVLQSPAKAISSATCLLQSLLSAGWEDVRVAVEEVTATKHITTLTGNNMTPDQKRDALAVACLNTRGYDCNFESCPVCGVCTQFADTSDETACELYAEAVRRGAIKEEQ